MALAKYTTLVSAIIQGYICNEAWHNVIFLWLQGLDDDIMKSAAIDVFSYVVEYSPPMVREYIIQEGHKQDDEDLLINLVIDQMISDTDPELGGAVQLMGILRVLIDPENMLASATVSRPHSDPLFHY